MVESGTAPNGADPRDLGGFHLQVGPVELVKLQFERRDGNGEEDPSVGDVFGDINFTMRAWRASENTLGLELTAEAAEQATHAFHITGRTVLQVSVIDPVNSPVDLDHVFPGVGGQIGPVIIYPYIREAVADLSRRAGITPITLPVLNMGSMFEIPAETVAWKPATGKAAARRSRKSKKSQAT